jgi:F-type H+-transporting ATPase subunit b
MKNLFKSARLSFILSILFLLLASVAFASEGGEGGHGNSHQLMEFAWKTLDFVVLVGFLYWLLAEKIKDFFVGRRQGIKDSQEKATKDKAEAEKKFKEYSEKIDKASAEIDGIFEMIKAQGLAEKQKIIEDAEKIAKKIKEDALMRTEQELKRATDELRKEAVALSVQMAEEIIKRNITAQDNEAIVREFMEKVVTEN